jgi:tellurite resistance protein TerC
MVDTLWPWVTFNLFILCMLFIDLKIMHAKSHIVSIKEALYWSLFWICLALGFNVIIYYTSGSEAALNFLTAYLLEKSLSVDNLFVFLLIFEHFHTPAIYLHRVLFLGIVGAIVMRALFIVLGLTLIHWVSGILYIFGLFLMYMGIKMTFKKDNDEKVEENALLRTLRKYLPITKEYVNGHYFIRKDGGLWATPLFLVLISLETADVVFAIDSIPAVFAITLDPFIIYTSNIFAILGLRSLFFALAGIMGLFHYLHYGLGCILIFIGAKMVVGHYITIPVTFTLSTIALCIGVSIGASLLYPQKKTH